MALYETTNLATFATAPDDHQKLDSVSPQSFHAASEAPSSVRGTPGGARALKPMHMLLAEHGPILGDTTVLEDSACSEPTTDDDSLLVVDDDFKREEHGTAAAARWFPPTPRAAKFGRRGLSVYDLQSMDVDDDVPVMRGCPAGTTDSDAEDDEFCIPPPLVVLPPAALTLARGY